MYMALFVLLIPTYFFLRFIWELLTIGDFTNKPVFITGCDTGFGRALALKCVQQGLPVFAGCLTKEGAGSLAKEASKSGGSLETLLLDISSEESVKSAHSFVEERVKQFGGLHGLVNNAGIVGTSFQDDFLTVDDYKNCAEVNLWGTIRCTHAFKPLIKQKRGRIVNTASICGRLGMPCLGPYTVTKFAVEGYTDVLRQELRAFGVSVHTFEPGLFKTAMTDGSTAEERINFIWNRASEETRKQYGENFFFQGKDSTKTALETTGSTSLDWVVDGYLHALTAVFPRTRYQCGWDANLFYIPFSFVPSKIQDVFMSIGLRLAGVPKPAGALQIY